MYCYSKDLKDEKVNRIQTVAFDCGFGNYRCRLYKHGTKESIRSTFLATFSM